MTATEHGPIQDHHVKESVLAELDWTPGIASESIGVAVADGAVTLSGQVHTYPQRRAAIKATLRVRGVTAVADEIEVHGPRSPHDDTDLAREVGAVLERVIEPSGTVKAEVRDQIVVLTGSVAWQHEREAVTRAVAAVPGVRDVTNHVAIKPTVHVSAVLAKGKIVDALRRNAGVEADRITVEVSGDTITLRGVVASWAERSQAAHAAWATPGVAHVQNDLTVTR